jgi:nicotinate-nucleotide adenylyltransferase
VNHEDTLRALPKKGDDDRLWVAHFGGLFNPVHLSHIGIGKALIEKYSFDKVVYVPGSDYYPKPGLASEASRFKLLQLSIDGHPGLEASDYELGKDNWTEPIETLEYLKNKYSQDVENVRLFTIRGEDWLPNMAEWVDELAEHEGMYEFIIVPRTYDRRQDKPVNYKKTDIVSRMSYLMKLQAPLEVSSTLVRERLQSGDATANRLVSAKVLEEIRRLGLYGTTRP